MSPNRGMCFAVTIAVACVFSGAPSHGQCATVNYALDPTFGNELGGGGGWAAHAAHDDGSGPALYVGANRDSPEGGIPWQQSALLRKTAAGWSAVPGITNKPDPACYLYPAACASSGWRSVRCLKSTTVNGQPVLAVGGDFICPSGGSFGLLGPTGWLPTGGASIGAPGWCVGNAPCVGAFVTAVESYDDGAGEKLYVAGFFDKLGGVTTGCVGRYTGSAWEACGMPVAPIHVPPCAASTGPWRTQVITDLISFDDGTGTKLYASGVATDPLSPLFPSGVMRYDGASWQPVGAGQSAAPPTSSCGSLFESAGRFAIHDDGGAAALYLILQQPFPSSTSCVYKWDGAAWSQLPTTVAGPLGQYYVATFVGGQLWSSAHLPYGNMVGGLSGPALHGVGFLVDSYGAATAAIFAYDSANSAWVPCFADQDSPSFLVGGFFVESMIQRNGFAVWDDGAGPAVYLSDGGWYPGCVGPAWSPGGAVYLCDGMMRLRAASGAPMVVEDPVQMWFYGQTGSSWPGQFYLVNAKAGGYEYYNIVSFDLCGGGVGSGPYLGLCASTPADFNALVAQLMTPIGTPPFHVAGDGYQWPNSIFSSPGIVGSPSSVAVDILSIEIGPAGSLCIGPTTRQIVWL